MGKLPGTMVPVETFDKKKILQTRKKQLSLILIGIFSLPLRHFIKACSVHVLHTVVVGGLPRRCTPPPHHQFPNPCC